MTVTLVNAAGLDWRYWPQALPPTAGNYQVVAFVHLVDELTRSPPRVPVQAATRLRGLDACASAGGLAGLAGRPTALYPDPWPAASPRVALTVTAEGFLPLALGGALPLQPSFPAGFQALDLGIQGLRRRSTAIVGRAVDAAGSPVAGATVAVTALWPTVDALAGPGAAPDGLSLWTGLYADRPAGATVRRRTLSILAAPKTLLLPAAAGATRLRLSNRQGLLVGRPLAIAPGDPERTEYIPLAAVETSSSDDQPAWVTLHHPLAHSHPAGAEVARTGFNAPGAANALTREARRGDRTLLTAGLAGLTPANTTVEVSGGAATEEYHGCALWQAVTGPDGRYRLPPIHRLAHLELTASGGGQPQPARRLVSLAGEPETTADLVFP